MGIEYLILKSSRCMILKKKSCINGKEARQRARCIAFDEVRRFVSRIGERRKLTYRYHTTIITYYTAASAVFLYLNLLDLLLVRRIK
jgi:hypothetical protein